MDAEQRNALLDVFIHRVSPAELRAAVFKLLGAGAYDNLTGSTHIERCIAFMEELYRKDREDKLLSQLSKICPDIDVTEPVRTEIPFDVADEYSVYQTGIRELLYRLDDTHPCYADVLVYQQRLNENIARSRRYGDTEMRRAERAEIVAHLNTLTSSVMGISFGKLCDSSK